MLPKTGHVNGVIDKHGGIWIVIIAKGLIHDDGNVKNSSLLQSLCGNSASGWRRRGRNDSILSFQ
jgi:hypothetical protein